MVGDLIPAWGTALYLGDTEECHQRLMAMACNRCGQLCCDGYPCYPWEEQEVLDVLRGGCGHPDADYDQVCIMLGDPGVVMFCDPIQFEEGVNDDGRAGCETHRHPSR